MSSLEASVTLDDVFVVVAARRVPLAPELAGYLVLEIAEGASPRGGDVDPKSVFIGEEGSVAIVRPRGGDGEGDAEASVRLMLARLLEGAGAQPAALAAATRRPCGAGLAALARELEAALIPVNRAAARRALARFAREVRRVTLGIGRNASIAPNDPPPSRRPSIHPPPSSGQPDSRSDASGSRPASKADPDETLSSAARPEQRSSPSRPSMPRVYEPTPPPSPTSKVDELVASFTVSGEGEHRAARELKGLVGIDLTPPPPTGMSPLASGAEGAELLSLASDESSGRPRQPKAPADVRGELRAGTPVRVSVAKGLVALMVLGACALGGAVSWMRSQAKDSGATSPSILNRVAAAVHVPFAAACRSSITVVDVPPNGEVYLREGQSPADIGPLPVGARADLLVTAEGFLARRAIVPAGATWDNGPDGTPRYELPVQLERAGNSPEAWPAPAAGARAGGGGPPGVVHVVTAPRGADVWRLVGSAPEATVELSTCDGEVDLLVAGGAPPKKRLRVVRGDFTVQAGTRSARVSAK